MKLPLMRPSLMGTHTVNTYWEKMLVLSNLIIVNPSISSGDFIRALQHKNHIILLVLL